MGADQDPQGNIRKRPHGCGGTAAAPTTENGEERAAPRWKRRLVNFWPVRPRRARRQPRLPRKGWVPPDIAEAGDRLRARPIRRTLHGLHTCARSRSGIPLFGVQLLPMAVRPDGSRALSRIRAKSGQTFAESPGEAYPAARRSFGGRACVVLH